MGLDIFSCFYHISRHFRIIWTRKNTRRVLICGPNAMGMVPNERSRPSRHKHIFILFLFHIEHP